MFTMSGTIKPDFIDNLKDMARFLGWPPPNGLSIFSNLSVPIS